MPETLKLLKKNIEHSLTYTVAIFLGSPKAKEIKTNKQMVDLIESFGTAKETVNKMNRQPNEWGKILEDNITNVCSVTQPCPTLFGPMNCSLSGSSVHGFPRKEY